MRHLGNLTVTTENVHDFPAVSEIYGHLTIAKDAHLFATSLQHVRGWITVHGALDLPHFGGVNGWMTLGPGATVNAPEMTGVTNALVINADSLLNAPKLNIVGDLVLMQSAVAELGVAEIRGNLTLSQYASLLAPRLHRVEKSITLKAGATLGASELSYIGGYYDADETATIVAPKFLA